MRNSASYLVRVLSSLVARDEQSVPGKNNCYVMEASGLNPWCIGYGRLRDALVVGEVVDVLQQDRWRLPYISSELPLEPQERSINN